jgi:hypothetical protein
MTQQISFAPESARVQKVRERIRDTFDKFDQRITPQALQEKTEEIRRWIERHADHRVPLKEKQIALFDENQNSAQIGPRVRAIAQRLCLAADTNC